VTLFLLAASAFWLGVLTSLSLCTIATNTAAFTFLVRNFADGKKLFQASLSYTLGRVLVYILLGYGLAAGFLSIPGVSSGLMRDFGRFLGPILIIVGVLVLDWVRFPFRIPFNLNPESLFKPDIFHSFLMGVLFALAFCPVAAALFFGALVPLSIDSRSPVLLPALYGFGTGLPIVALVFSLRLGSLVFRNRLVILSRWEGIMRGITGGAFVAVGLYQTLTILFPVF
jgi:cytochrome c biogenesis protein CcdA